MKLTYLVIINRYRSLTNTLKSTTRHISSSSHSSIIHRNQNAHTPSTIYTNPISTFPRKLHSEISFVKTATESEEDYEDEEEEEDGTMTEFLSRFVWIMRGKLTEAYPGVDKETANGMLLIIVEKIIEELEKGGDGIRDLMKSGGENAVSGDFSEELWKTVWEVSKTVLEDMEKERKKEAMKKYIYSEEVKEMCRFASEVGVRGNMLREFRFKWAKEKMEEAEFYQNLSEMRRQAAALGEDEDDDDDEENDDDEEGEEGKEGEEIGTEGEEGKEGEEGQMTESEKSSEEVVEKGSDVETEVKPRVITLPQRRGKIKYKIYGLDLSDLKWAEVADNIHEAERLITPEEAKPITGKCKLVTEKILQLKEGDDPLILLAEWMELLKPSRVDWFALLDRLREANAGLYLKCRR